jgi:ABC-type phosphate transport system permease subunit
LWRISPTSAGLKWLSAAAILFLLESRWNTRYVAGLGATAAVIVSGYTQHVALYLAVPFGLAFGGITIWLATAGKRARRNKRVDL